MHYKCTFYTNKHTCFSTKTDLLLIAWWYKKKVNSLKPFTSYYSELWHQRQLTKRSISLFTRALQNCIQYFLNENKDKIDILWKMKCLRFIAAYCPNPWPLWRPHCMIQSIRGGSNEFQLYIFFLIIYSVLHRNYATFQKYEIVGDWRFMTF